MWGEPRNTALSIFNQLTAGNFAKYTSLGQCEIETCSPWGLKAIEYPARGTFSVATARKPLYCIPRPQLDQRMAKLLKEYNEDDLKKL
ncbi:hypothetical protein C0J52_09830 [Blattella germanica]|nr:hypothetical protein C0J52_09830 [Blattella germanica]